MSQVILCEELNVNSEHTLLEFVAKWASQPGRSIKVVDLVMPLVRFPLVNLLSSPIAELKVLQKCSTDSGSSVITELVQEAIKLQLETNPQTRKRFTPKKHTLIDGVLEGETEPRNKRRRLCKTDVVPTLDPAASILALLSST